MHTKSKGQSIDTLCGLFGRTRQAYYQQKKRVTTEAFESEVILQMIAKERKLMPRIGGRKLFSKIGPGLPDDLQMGRDKFFGFLRKGMETLVEFRARAAIPSYLGDCIPSTFN